MLNICCFDPLKSEDFAFLCFISVPNENQMVFGLLFEQCKQFEEDATLG